MQRALIAIGIRKTGGLPELTAAQQSAQEVADWGLAQGIAAERVQRITDAQGKVGRERIFDAVEQVTQLGFVEQLIVYFSGHGINSGMYEQWLLSRAPDDPGAAVNLLGSEMLARQCGIPHVVFISDACRTAADSIQAQRVTGGEIFPNPRANGPEQAVDQYFATLVGSPAFEVKDPTLAAGNYRAAYTTVLLQALRGEVPGLVEQAGGQRLIRPRPLKKHLASAVPAYLHGLQLSGAPTQQPDARILSDDAAWLAELRPQDGAEPAGAPLPPPPIVLPPVGGRRPVGVRPAAPGLELAARAGLRDMLMPAPAGAPRGGLVHDAADRATERLLHFGPDHFETQCGIKLRGARLQYAGSREAQAVLGAQRDVVQVDLRGAPAANVLVRLEDGTAVVVPALRETITSLIFDAEGNLDDVWCQPSANTPRYPAWQSTADEVSRLHAAIAAAAAAGVFRLDDEATATALLARMRDAKAVDPTLAVYAAWALHARRLRPQIVQMQQFLDRDLGVRLFDVAMLARQFDTTPRDTTPLPIYPCVPMLTQGWALLAPLEIRLPERLAALRGLLRPSLWTHFSTEAFARLQAELG